MNNQSILVRNDAISLVKKIYKYTNNIPPGSTLKKDSWVYKAIEETQELIKYLEKNQLIDMKSLYTRERIFGFQASIIQLQELNQLIQLFSKVPDTSRQTYIRKLNKIFKMPLIPSLEKDGNNEGRNILFELRLFQKFINKGYRVELLEHPDIKVVTNKHKFSIECKRLFLPERFKPNIEDAIDQLEKYSLKDNDEYGIVAINVSRIFDINKNSQLYIAQNSKHASIKVKQDYENFINQTINDYRKIKFPTKIPIIIFEFYEFGLIGGGLSSFNYTDFSNSQAHSMGINLYDILMQDFYKLYGSDKQFINKRMRML